MARDLATSVRRHTLRGFRPWQEFVSASFPWLDVDGASREFRAEVIFRAFGERSFAVMAADDCRVTRTNRDVGRSDAGHLKVLWQRAGSMSVEQDRRETLLRAGCVAVCDTGRPYRLRLHDRARLAVLTLPYEAIPGWERLSGNVCATTLGDRNVFGAALAAALHMLEDRDDTNDGAERILGAVQSMLTASLHRSAAGRPSASARLELGALQQHILAHLDDPELSPDELAAALHVSRRTLYGLFKEQSITPSRFIREIRLRSVREALADRANARRTILEIALDHGFNDSASFCRIFKSAVGVSPSVWRDRALAE